MLLAVLPALLASQALALDPPPPTGDDFVQAAGGHNHEKLATLAFTFRVEKGGKEVAARQWRWDRDENTVTRTVDGTSLTFTPGSPANEADKQADAQWINDSFWFSPAMHLDWAEDVELVYENTCDHWAAPDLGLQCVRANYPGSGGGYTPGDSYRLYLGPDNLPVAWDYIPAGKTEPAMSTSFTDYVDAGPLKVATEHKSEDGGFRLWFDGIEATTR